jgi:hypothetical protein
MAKIIFTATGKVEHVEANMAHLFVASGAARYVPDAPKPVEESTPKWRLTQAPTGTDYALTFTCPDCKTVSNFFPPVDWGAERIGVVLLKGLCVHKLPIPEKMLADYIKAGGGTPPLVPGGAASPENQEMAMALEARARAREGR